MATRVVVYDFAGSGSFTPNGSMYGGQDSLIERNVVENADPTLGLFVETVPGSGVLSDGALFFAEQVPEDAVLGTGRESNEYQWSATAGSVSGLEVTFKTDASGPADFNVEMSAGQSTPPGRADIAFAFTRAAGINDATVEGVDASGNEVSTPVSVPVAADVSQWMTAKVLPTGAWSLAYASGGTILSGQLPAPAVDGSRHADSFLIVQSERAAAGGTVRVAPLWIDDVVFWLTSNLTAPPLRIHPRSDGLGLSSAVRIWPPPRSQQYGGRPQPGAYL